MSNLNIDVTVRGICHGMLDEIPKESTWILNKSERVVNTGDNSDLKKYLLQNSTFNEYLDRSIVHAYEVLKKALML